MRGHNNEVVGAIEVLVPQYRAKIEQIMPQLEEAASSISTALGFNKQGLSAGIEREVSAQSTGGASAAQSGFIASQSAAAQRMNK